MINSMKKLMFKKIHFGYALFIMVAFSAAPVAILLGSIFFTTPTAQAFGPWVGLEVLSPPIKCVLDPKPDAQTCLASCSTCGDLPGGWCNGLFEVKARYLGGTNLLYKNMALCITPPPTPPNGGTFRPSSRCMGEYLFTGIVHQLSNFGCYR